MNQIKHVALERMYEYGLYFNWIKIGLIRVNI